MRQATEEDCQAFLAVHQKWKGKAAGALMGYADDAAIAAHIRQAADTGLAVVVDGYFILYCISPLWYTKKTFLIEEIILRIYPTDAPPSVAVQALEELRDLFDCTAVISGDAQAGAMAAHYLAAGFVHLGSQFIKTH